MTDKEKAEAYDGLIERLKDLKFAYRFSSLSDTIEEKFPELEESKDKKIRKELIRYVKECTETGKLLSKYSEEWIAWLEKQGEQNLTWNADDEYHRNIILYVLNNEIVGKEDKENAINWLKSLRPRSQWKPSKEQMKTFEYYIDADICNKDKEILFGLYAGLKKLMGE